MPHRPEVLARAYAACEALARSHYENFPVASRLLPRRMRPHVAAVYAFARVADDLADEGTAPAAERLAQLNAWQRRLHAAVAVERSADAPHEHEDLIVVALAHSIRLLDLPMALFDDLLSAFAQDTMTTRYASWDAVRDYCRRSADPVGRLVLRIAGYRDDALDRSSDALCTALQLTNFWQDFGRDWRACGARGRRRLRGGRASLSALTEAWIAALDLCRRDAPQFDRAGGLRRGPRPPALQLRLTWLGGTEQARRTRASLMNRPTLGAGDVAAILWRCAAWRSHV